MKASQHANMPVLIAASAAGKIHTQNSSAANPPYPTCESHRPLKPTAAIRQHRVIFFFLLLLSTSLSLQNRVCSSRLFVARNWVWFYLRQTARWRRSKGIVCSLNGVSFRLWTGFSSIFADRSEWSRSRSTVNVYPCVLEPIWSGHVVYISLQWLTRSPRTQLLHQTG